MASTLERGDTDTATSRRDTTRCDFRDIRPVDGEIRPRLDLDKTTPPKIEEEDVFHLRSNSGLFFSLVTMTLSKTHW